VHYTALLEKFFWRVKQGQVMVLEIVIMERERVCVRSVFVIFAGWRARAEGVFVSISFMNAQTAGRKDLGERKESKTCASGASRCLLS
jgi:hypothetical protein